MKSRKRKKSTKKSIKTFEINPLIRSILVGISILLILSFYTNGMGVVGRFLDNSFYYLLGTASRLLPFILIFIAINSYLNSIETSDLLLVLNGLILLIFSSLFFDTISNSPGIYKNRFFMDMNRSLLGVNGGITGGFLNSYLLKLFGGLGLSIIIVSVFAVSLIVFFNLDYKNIGDNIYIGLGNIATSTKNFFNKKADSLAKKKEMKKDRHIAINKDEILNVKEIETVSSSDFFPIEEEIKEIDINDNYSGFDEVELEEEVILKAEKVTEKDRQELKREIEAQKKEEYKYEYPPLSLLNKSKNPNRINRNEILENSKIIEETMANFNIEARVEKVNTGPTVTSYELIPAPDVKLSKIVGLADNLAFSLASSDIRIEAPIPGKAAVGIEVPNRTKAMVSLEEVINSREFREFPKDLPLVLGRDVEGNTMISSIEDMPHLLIAGATGSGKSVCINSIIISLLYKTSPKDLRMILIDPKIVELSIYNSIPHLLIPVVTNPKKAATTLLWAVEEMERRYKLFAENMVKDIRSYNQKKAGTDETIPKIVIIIDELADLMMVASNEVEDYVGRLAQMARAAGMHLILATQRPSVDVITGTIKANIPSRISFAVSSQIDSRTILDLAGAEKLLGKGDMLFYPSSYSKPKRIQGSFVTEEEVENVVDFFKNHEFDSDSSEEIMEEIENVKIERELEDDTDPLFMQALKLVVYDEQASISYLQRKLRIGYSRAARIVDQMEEKGMVGPSNGPRPRDIFITEEDYLKMMGEQ